MSAKTIKVASLLPIGQPVVTTQVMPINLGNRKLNSTVPGNIPYNPVSNPVSLVLRSNLPPSTTPNALNKPPPPLIVNHNSTATAGENRTEIVYQFINPEDLNLRYIKRGRKKAKTQDTPVEVKVEPPPPPVKAPRTRSGRIVKTPKHMGKDFEKIISTHSAGFKTEKFTQSTGEHGSKTEFQVLENHIKKKTVPPRYRCSICNKSYLSKKAAYLHLLKNPDHGPLPDENNNFEVWNYLVDITQKRPSGQRGVKFCEELTNLLHNLQLLTGALFKTESTVKNNSTQKTAVQIDKILGNAMGLQPGRYYFDENELYKDVTVLKLITNSQFFAPKKAPPDAETEKRATSNRLHDKSFNNTNSSSNADNNENPPSNTTKLPAESSLNESAVEVLSDVHRNKTRNDENTSLMEIEPVKCDKAVPDAHVPQPDRHLEKSSDETLRFSKSLPASTFSNNQTAQSNFEIKTADDVKTDAIAKMSHRNCLKTIGDHLINGNFDNPSTGDVPEKTMSFPQHLLAPSSFESKCMSDLKPDCSLKLPNSTCVDGFSKTIDDQIMVGTYKKLDTSLSLHTDLLSDNSLLTLPNLRTPDDEMMLTNVDTGSNLLDNSTSSDEVMNVDQFVNERFKKITEPDTDIKFNTSLNLDLPSLDLFQFHTS